MRRKTESVKEVYGRLAPSSRLYLLKDILTHTKEQANAVGKLEIAFGNGPLARASIEIDGMIKQAISLETTVKLQREKLEGLKVKSYRNIEKKRELLATLDEISKKVQETVAEIAENGRQIVIKALGEARLAMNGNGQNTKGGNGTAIGGNGQKAEAAMSSLDLDALAEHHGGME